jgi:hypothetical protein
VLPKKKKSLCFLIRRGLEGICHIPKRAPMTKVNLNFKFNYMWKYLEKEDLYYH